MLESGEAVLARPLSDLVRLAGSEDQLYASFYLQIAGGVRRSNDDQFETSRPAVEATLFPHYHADIVAAALSTRSHGLTRYGPCALTLKRTAIEERASVFEENPLTFVRSHRLGIGDPIPYGHRAAWADRHLLAVAKLGDQLQPSASAAEFPSILILPRTPPAEDDFIEVHIFGKLSRRSLSRVAISATVQRLDRPLVAEVERCLTEVGITVERV